MSLQTAESIMDLVQSKVSNNEPMSPSYWCEAALRVNSLAGEFDNRLASLEAELNQIEAEFIATDMPANKAKVLARSKIDYGEYLKLRAKIKRIENFLVTARKRSMIQDI